MIAVLAPASSADAIPSPRPDIDQRLPAPSSATGASPPEGLERVTGAVDRREGAIILRDEQRNEVMRWKFTRGWATKLTGPALKGE